eukprot:5945995-Prymnesium_polylepis.2
MSATVHSCARQILLCCAAALLCMRWPAQGSPSPNPRTQLHGIEAMHVAVKGRSRIEYDAELSSQLQAAGCQIVLLVGFMRIVSAEFCECWSRRALNIHPSLLPKFAGGMDLEVHAAVIAAGEDESGCTVHMVEAVVDAGEVVVHHSSLITPIIPSSLTPHQSSIIAGEIVVQQRCPVIAGEAPEDLKARRAARISKRARAAVTACRTLSSPPLHETALRDTALSSPPLHETAKYESA